MPSLRHQYAQHILSEYHETFENIPMLQGRTLESSVDPVHIGVVGAGAAGLYVALMLDWLKAVEPEFKYTYDLLEANPDANRIGGRLYTHHFSGGDCDYYDVGAMRFPELPWMKPTFDLMNYLGIVAGPNVGNRINYVMSTDNNISFYNNIPLTQSAVTSNYNEGIFDPFNTQLTGLDRNPEEILNAQIGYFKENFVKLPFKEAWEAMMKYDAFSTRIFMKTSVTLPEPWDQKPVLSDWVISYLETLDSSTNLYDCALSESVFDSLDFDYPVSPAWYCILGGTDLIASKAIAKLSQPVQRGKRVTAIAPVITPGNQLPTGVGLTISTATGMEQATYDHVISTMPLSCLSVVDTSKCELGWETTSSIRQLHYDGSVKVAIQFSRRWWQDSNMTLPQMGGVSSTDRPTRTVVYPSYGLGDANAAATMIVSYTWAQDAFRFGSFLTDGTTKAPPDLLDVILKDLTDIHQIRNAAGNIDYTVLPGLVKDNHAWDWYGHESSMGAFALFGPGQFKNLYPKVTQPAFGRLHFAGEATSVHHAWVVGALNSAYRALAEVFSAHGDSQFIQRLRDNDSPFQSAAQGEFEVDTIHKQVALGLEHGRRLATGA